jgi:disulfide bond formation protein DsbB
MNKFLSIILFISAASLGVAYMAEHVFELKPCILCLYERIPYFAAALLSILALVSKKTKLVTILLLMTFMCGAALSFYHVGVEQHIFAGTDACNGDTKAASSIEELKAQLYSQKAPSCSEAAFTFLSISFAGWNFILSLILSIFCARYLRNER